jgi:hypothetical protein
MSKFDYMNFSLGGYDWLWNFSAGRRRKDGVVRDADFYWHIFGRVFYWLARERRI